MDMCGYKADVSAQFKCTLKAAAGRLQESIRESMLLTQ